MLNFPTRRRSAGQHRYQRRGRHFRNGERAAALRAWTAANLILGRPICAPNLTDAADMTGANKGYVAAMLTVLQAEDEDLVLKVLAGEVPVLAAAESMKARAALIEAFRKAGPDDLAALTRTVGVDRVFDTVIAPALV